MPVCPQQTVQCGRARGALGLHDGQARQPLRIRGVSENRRIEPLGQLRVRGDHLYAIVRDELDVQYVVRARIERDEGTVMNDR